MTTLIEEGTSIYIHNVIDKNGKHLPSFDIVIGEDILNSTDDDEDYYDEYQGRMVVEERVVEEAIYEYMENNYPNVINYNFLIDET